MIKFFRRIRQQLISQNKFSKYLFYAVGEIILVVIGILIALSINNWNEGRKEKLVEIEILEGIRNDILQDTVDINANIRSHEFTSKRNKQLYEHLANKKELNKEFINLLWYNINDDLFLSLHNSYFSEVKQKGLSLISNTVLRNKINRLYEFDYKILSEVENNHRNFKYYNELLTEKITGILIADSTRSFNLTQESYNKLMSDYNFKALIVLQRSSKEQLLNDFYLPTRESALRIVGYIESELDVLKE